MEKADYTKPFMITGATCQPCHALLQWLAEQGISVPYYIAQEHLTFCRERNIRTVPTLVLPDGTLIVGAEEIKSYFQSQKELRTKE